MEHAEGARLHEKWDAMSSEQHVACVRALSSLVGEMASITLPAYGSLYFADISIEPSQKIDLGSGFCIGPSCSPIHWDCITGERRDYALRKPNHGPCR
jgi:hypothetical protein